MQELQHVEGPARPDVRELVPLHVPLRDRHRVLLNGDPMPMSEARFRNLQRCRSQTVAMAAQREVRVGVAQRSSSRPRYETDRKWTSQENEV